MFGGKHSINSSGCVGTGSWEVRRGSSMTALFVPLHVTPHTEILSTPLMLAFVRLFSSM